MYIVQPISAREVVDLGSDIEQMDFGSNDEHIDLGSESDIFDVERSQIHLPQNMRTNVTTYV